LIIQSSCVVIWIGLTRSPLADPNANPLILHGHKLWINTLAFSPDGHWIATGSGDNTTRLWDLSASDPYANPLILRGHEDQVNSLAFSPDGHWLATGSDDNTTRLWIVDAADPDTSPQVLRSHEDQVNTLAFSPDGNWLATGGGNKAGNSSDHAVRLWNLGVTGVITHPLLLIEPP
jgi:WD40 repeat protein